MSVFSAYHGSILRKLYNFALKNNRTMAKKQLLNGSIITAGDIKRRHPRYMTCDTDKQYAQLANDIYDLIHPELGFAEDHEIRNASISLALYFEDLKSGTHVFETFTHLYKKMFGSYLPFYASETAESPTASLDAMRFMLWHSLCAEREQHVLNPTNDGMKEIAKKLLELWESRKATIPANEELADYIFSEETQEDADHVKLVLIWLSRHCCLGRWHTNPRPDEDPNLRHLFQGADKDTQLYAGECFSLFEHPVWPLSLMPQHIYAEMIRLDMDDPDDELAEAIDHMEWKPFAIYQVMDTDSQRVRLKDFRGETFSIRQSDFEGNVRQLARQKTHLAGAFISLSGQWRLNGPCLWSNPTKKQQESFLERMRKEYSIKHDYAGQYDSFIASHGGERLYFFRDSEEYMQWMEKELGLQRTELPLPDDYLTRPLVAFFEDNGTICQCFYTKAIKHPANPYYDKASAEELGMTFMCGDACSPGMLLHLLKHDLLPDAMFNDFRGREHGRLLMQDNIEFVARCLGRNIESSEVVRPRTHQLDTSNEESVMEKYASKMSYEQFVEMIDAEDIVVSRSHKDWEVVMADNVTTVIRDVEKDKEFEMATRDLYEAFIALDENDIQIATVAKYVGKKNAPAASALLYATVGQGQGFNNLRKVVNEAVQRGGLNELERLIRANFEKNG